MFQIMAAIRRFHRAFTRSSVAMVSVCVCTLVSLCGSSAHGSPVLEKHRISDSQDRVVACFHSAGKGYLLLRGSLHEEAQPINPDPSHDECIARNLSGDAVALIKAEDLTAQTPIGDMYCSGLLRVLEPQSFPDGSSLCFSIVNCMGTTVSAIDRSGNLYLSGGLGEDWPDPEDGSPLFLSQPANHTVVAGTSATLAVEVRSVAVPSFQWYHDSLPIAEGASSVLYLPSVLEYQQGAYFCIVTCDLGTTTSESAYLTVENKPEFVSDPLELPDAPMERAYVRDIGMYVIDIDDPADTLVWCVRNTFT